MPPETPLLDRSQIQRIQELAESALDRLPFGAIQLDKDGTILAYNQTEAELVGRKKESVVGRNFFTDVAPCTDVKEFAGQFREGIQKGDLHTVFPFTFALTRGPLKVWITLFYNEQSGSAWVFVHHDRRPPEEK